MTIRLRKSARGLMLAAIVASICSVFVAPASTPRPSDLERSISAIETHVSTMSRPSFGLDGIDRRQGGSVTPRWTPIAAAESLTPFWHRLRLRVQVSETRAVSIVRPRRLAFPHEANAPPVRL